ncbi:MAG: DegT/DnrJ/EryC1/StrS family aminotransferase [Thermodesulfobacteriota bacterium]
MFTNKDLAINGGPPVRTKPWLDNFTIGEEEKQAARRALDSGYLSLFEGSHAPDPPFSFWGGPEVQQLEKEWCAYYGVKYAVSMNSATSGLYAAIGALGLGYGDEVIVSPYTMSACAVCTLMYGAIPIFADVCLETGSLDPVSIEAHLTPRTKAVVVVHQFGIPADMDRIMALAQKHDLKVIEDCAQAHGAIYRGKYVGTIGDIGVFSLNVNKTIQVGEGAVCVTNDDDLRYRLALIRNHGEAVVEPAGYEDITNIIGFNYRLTEVAAAMATEQLKKLDKLNDRRLNYVRHLSNALTRYNCLAVPPACPHGPGCQDCRSTYYVYPLRYLPEVLGIKREEFAKVLNAEGVRFYQGYVRPLYLQPVYQRKTALKQGYPFSAPENRASVTNYYMGACPNAEKLHFEQMLINEHVRPPHTLSDIEDIISAFKKVIIETS